MNQQMQNYQRYAQAQNRAPNARRPGESAPSTSTPIHTPQHNSLHTPALYLIPPGLVTPPWTGNPNSKMRTFVPDSMSLHSDIRKRRGVTTRSQSPLKNWNAHQGQGRHPIQKGSAGLFVPATEQTSLRGQTAGTLDSEAYRPPDPELVRTAVHAQIIKDQIYEPLAYPVSERMAHMNRQIGPSQHPNVAAQQHQQQLYQQQMAQRNAALEHQLAQRRAKKPTDRNMPEGLEDIVIGDGVEQYKALREVEKKLDYTIMRKRLDIQDTINRNVMRQKTMRIWISNTVDNQPWQRPALDENSFDFESGADATYRVSIEGKIIDEDDLDDPESDVEEAAEGAPVKQPKPKAPRKKFSHYFKGITVEFDKAKNLANPHIDSSMQIEWKKTPQSAEVDCLEFQRKGDENMNITINLMRDEPVERFRLSKALSDVLDIDEADRAEVVMGIWEYVKFMGLQEDEERRHVRCDDKLRAVSRIPDDLFYLADAFFRFSIPKLSSSHKLRSVLCLIFTLCHPSGYPTRSDSIPNSMPPTSPHAQSTMSKS